MIGGIGTMEGPVIGAINFYRLQRYLADFGAWYLILLGALGILVMLFAPKGLWGLVSERFDLTLFPTRAGSSSTKSATIAREHRPAARDQSCFSSAASCSPAIAEGG